MPEQTPILDALQVSVIVNRRDLPGQVPWTEWRTGIVLTGGTPAQAGDIAILGPDGKLDPSVVPGGGGGGSVYVNGTLVTNPNFNAADPAPPSGYTNVIWQFDPVSGDVSAYYQASASTIPFGNITTGTNTAATMTVGPGAVLTFSGSGSPPTEGEINANFIYNVAVSGTAPAPSQALVYDGSSWTPEPVVNSFNGRTGAVLPESGDYSFPEIGGQLATDQLASVGGTGSKVQLTNQGATADGDVVTYDGNGNVQDSGTLLSSLAPLASPRFTGTAQFVNVYVTGTLADGTDSAGTPGYILSSTGTGTQWIPAPSSTTVKVNGNAVSSPDFNNSTPAAPGGFTNVVWQYDGSGNVSAYYATSGVVVTFGQVESGTNVAADMVVGPGATLTFGTSGSPPVSGTVNANELYGVNVSSTPTTAGQVLTSTSPTAADWQTPAPSSSANFLQVTADFGSDTGPIVRVTDVTTPVTAPWVTASSSLLATVMGVPTPSHGKDDGLLEGLTGQVEDIVPGVGFTLHAYSPLGSWGKYVFAVAGM